MTDKERLKNILDITPGDYIDEILSVYLFYHRNDLSFETIDKMYGQLCELRDWKIDELVSLKYVAEERAGYIKKYLEGKMWPTEELAREYLQPQIDNAQAIIDACGGK